MIKKFIASGFSLGRSDTARSLYWVFSGNAVLIVLTFFTTILVANFLTKAENGIFLALLTLSNLLSDLGEAGLGSSLSSFIPGLLVDPTKENILESKKFLASAFRIELILAIVLGGMVMLFSPFLSERLFAQTPTTHIILTGAITSILVLFGFSTFALSSHKKFQELALVNIFYSLVRLGLLVGCMFIFKLSLFWVLFIYCIAFLLGWLYSFVFLKPDFIFIKSSPQHTKKLIKFSSFLALQKVFVSISSRLDLLMLVPLSSAVEAGVYGIASRFSLIYPLFISSLGQVLAPKFAEFARSRDAWNFFKKTGVVIGFLLLTQVLFYISAPYLIKALIPKYIEAVPVFRALLIAMTGFIIATPFTSFLVYTLKKPYITTISSFVQLVIIFTSNILYIPQYGRFAPAIGIGIGNTFVCIIVIGFTWYFFKKEV